MKIHTCIIIDDEQYAVDALTGYIRAIPNLMLLNFYLDPLKALAELSRENGPKPDLVLMDIEMPLISGIDLSHQLRRYTDKLVFTTGYTKYGYQAFEVHADGYLLKPYSLSKFASTIGRLFPSENLPVAKATKDKFFFAKNRNDSHKLVKINIDGIVAVESKLNYILIHTQEGDILTHMTLSEMGKILKTYEGFAQFQRSFIIGVRHIDYVYGNSIRMQSGLDITVGDHFKKDFNTFVAERLLKGRS